VLSEKLEKPDHNRYDNIWEIRQRYPSAELLKEATSKVKAAEISADDFLKIGRALIFHDVKKFIRGVLQKRMIRLPIWKIVVPRLNGKSGAIYYIACGEDYNRVFRGTFGYCGTGPHESALIEAAFEAYELYFEVRDGDYLLGFLYPGF
jgi:hypothetical protein